MGEGGRRFPWPTLGVTKSGRREGSATFTSGRREHETGLTACASLTLFKAVERSSLVVRERAGMHLRSVETYHSYELGPTAR